MGSLYHFQQCNENSLSCGLYLVAFFFHHSQQVRTSCVAFAFCISSFVYKIITLSKECRFVLNLWDIGYVCRFMCKTYLLKYMEFSAEEEGEYLGQLLLSEREIL